MSRYRLVTYVLALLVSTSAFAQTQNVPTTQFRYVEAKTIALKQVFQTKLDWHVTAYKPEGDGAETGDLPVKICFWHDPNKKEDTKAKKHCTPILSEDGSPHQNLEDLSVVTLIQSSAPLIGVRSVARYVWGGSGSSQEVSVSTYNSATDEFSKVASVELSSISEYKIINSGTLSGSIITASGLWQQDEVHYGDHRFWIQVYKYSEYYRQYEKYIGYITLNKYPSEQLEVIEKELSAISRLAATAYGSNDPLKEPVRAKLDASIPGDSVVSLFYKALENGDGDLAASYVIPEKRLAGAFAPQNITRFYSSLAQPLRLTSVQALGQEVYEARYNFVDNSGRHCDGRAVVTTIQRNGSALIAEIKALNGC